MAKKTGAFEDYSGNELFPRTRASQVETDDGKIVQDKMNAYDAHINDPSIHSGGYVEMAESTPAAERKNNTLYSLVLTDFEPEDSGEEVSE